MNEWGEALTLIGVIIALIWLALHTRNHDSPTLYVNASELWDDDDDEPMTHSHNYDYTPGNDAWSRETMRMEHIERCIGPLPSQCDTPVRYTPWERHEYRINEFPRWDDEGTS